LDSLIGIADGRIIYLIEFVFNDNLCQKLNTVTVDLQIVHTYDRDDVVDDSATETDFIDKKLAVGVYPVS
jgi:hypothetical protein